MMLYSFDYIHCDLDLLPLSDEDRSNLRNIIVDNPFTKTEDLEKYLSVYYITQLKDSDKPYLYKYIDFEILWSFVYCNDTNLHLTLNDTNLYRHTGIINFKYIDYSFTCEVENGIVNSIKLNK